MVPLMLDLVLPDALHCHCGVIENSSAAAIIVIDSVQASDQNGLAQVPLHVHNMSDQVDDLVHAVLI